MLATRPRGEDAFSSCVLAESGYESCLRMQIILNYNMTRRLLSVCRILRSAAVGAFAAAAVPGPAAAAPAGEGVSAIRVELNKLEEIKGGCRAYLLLENRSGRAYRSFKLDLVMFDTAGIVVRRLAVEGAPLPEEKTSLRVFDVPGLPCSGIGRILVNDVLSCGEGADDRAACLAAIQPASRSETQLIK